MEGDKDSFVKLYTRFFHGSESILPRPVAIINRGRRVPKQFFPKWSKSNDSVKQGLPQPEGPTTKILEGVLNQNAFPLSIPFAVS